MTRPEAAGETTAQRAGSTELILVRHGVTAWNRERRFQGHTDPGLDDEGREQARRTAARLAREAVHAIYSSDLGRAWQTAAPIARALGQPPQPAGALRERHYGAFEGRSHDELMRDEPRAFERWERRDPDFALPGGGESLREFNARVLDFVRELLARHRGERVVTVTHGGVLDCVYRLATGMALEAPRKHALLNASINRIGWSDGRYAVLGWADVSHLSDALDDIEARA